MAIMVLKSPQVTINAVDLSSYVTEVTINYEAAVIDTTASGAAGQTKIAGLKNWTADVTFNQDYAASQVDATLFPLVGAAQFAVTFKPASGATSATNPQYSGNAILPSYSPIAGKVGDLLTTKITLEGSGDLSRATS